MSGSAAIMHGAAHARYGARRNLALVCAAPMYAGAVNFLQTRDAPLMEPRAAQGVLSTPAAVDTATTFSTGIRWSLLLSAAVGCCPLLFHIAIVIRRRRR